ncbi:uncharacterized protein K452DRAFT_89606 [Aplosporella prunicola CBS 121167]|uniref:Receptor L-domain domain-containing protein n=1 Tax=Aplosporella prunicola CBS 121167 TaxID=1176127 RepID=A0A6A6B6M2_9PEZI|nr:uncharacterized protein K452DRAFT_89606 [Aplosporella prunicola CBS 121167]KAF2138637.1 hypothetical protein K452DRAFT_89606 [Aplosporella prunicola CBS 121167]
MFAKILSFILFFSFVSAACSGNTTLYAASETSALATCTTYSGNVSFATSVAGDVNLDNIEVITGNLNITGASNITSLTGNHLSSLGGFILRNLSSSAPMEFVRLTNLTNLIFYGFQALSGFSLSTDLTWISDVVIEGSRLTDIDGLGLQNVNTIGSLSILRNQYLENVSLPNLRTTFSSIDIYGKGFLNLSLPLLSRAGPLDLRHIAYLYIPTLEALDGGLSLYDTKLDTISAPKLGSIDSLALENNTRLYNMSFPSLYGIYGYMIMFNNSDLSTISLEALEWITYNTILLGNFTSISFPAMTELEGALDISTSEDMDCSPFEHMVKSGIVKERLQCNTSEKAISVLPPGQTQTSISNQSAPTSGGTSEGLSTGAKIGIGVGVAGGAIGAIAISASLLLIRRNRKKNQAVNESTKDEKEQKDPRVPAQPVHELEPENIQELEHNRIANEMGADREVLEAQGSEALYELPVGGPRERQELEGDTPRLHSPVRERDSTSQRDV